MRELLASDRRGFFGRLGAAMVLGGAAPALMMKAEGGQVSTFQPAPPIKIPSDVAEVEELPADVSNREAIRWAREYLERRITVTMRAIPNDGRRARYVNTGMVGTTFAATLVGMEHGTPFEITVELMKGLETLALLINGSDRTVSIKPESPFQHEYGAIESGPKIHLRMMKMYDIERNQMIANFSVLLANEDLL